MTESESFRLARHLLFQPTELGDAIASGELDAGVVIPYDFARDLQRGRQATVQILLNAMNANTAAIAQGYAGRRDSRITTGRMSGERASTRRFGKIAGPDVARRAA